MEWQMLPNVKLNFVFFILFAILNLFSVVAGQKRNNVEVKTLHKPESCETGVEYGETVYIHYSAYLESGEMIDSTLNKKPLLIEIGGKHFISGMSIGINGMCVGEKRQLVIPPEYAYGHSGYPPYIPPDATLTFDVQLMSVKSAATEELVFRILRFLIAPVAAICIVMYLYNKYQKFPSKKELKVLTKNKKKN